MVTADNSCYELGLMQYLHSTMPPHANLINAISTHTIIIFRKYLLFRHLIIFLQQITKNFNQNSTINYCINLSWPNNWISNQVSLSIFATSYFASNNDAFRDLNSHHKVGKRFWLLQSTSRIPDNWASSPENASLEIQ